MCTMRDNALSLCVYYGDEADAVCGHLQANDHNTSIIKDGQRNARFFVSIHTSAAGSCRDVGAKQLSWLSRVPLPLSPCTPTGHWFLPPLLLQQVESRTDRPDAKPCR